MKRLRVFKMKLALALVGMVSAACVCRVAAQGQRTTFNQIQYVITTGSDDLRENSLRHPPVPALYVDHYSHRRNHQGIENKLIEPPEFLPKVGRMRCQKQLGGLLNYYYREAA